MIVASAALVAAHGIAAARQDPGPRLSVENPVTGQVISRHFVMVKGRYIAPGRPEIVSASATGRGLEGDDGVARDGGFRFVLPLKSGRTTVLVRIEGGSGRPDWRTLAERRISVRRAAPRKPDPRGPLDLATAWYVADRQMSIACKTAPEGCPQFPRCVRITRAIVDCPIAVGSGRDAVCLEVWSVRRDAGGHVTVGDYACQPRPISARTARRFVRHGAQVKRERFIDRGNRLDRTPHGVPLFDITRDVMAR